MSLITSDELSRHFFEISSSLTLSLPSPLSSDHVNIGFLSLFCKPIFFCCSGWVGKICLSVLAPTHVLCYRRSTTECIQLLKKMYYCVFKFSNVRQRVYLKVVCIYVYMHTHIQLQSLLRLFFSFVSR